jgi:hypothetical protein
LKIALNSLIEIVIVGIGVGGIQRWIHVRIWSRDTLPRPEARSSRRFKIWQRRQRGRKMENFSSGDLGPSPETVILAAFLAFWEPRGSSFPE